MTEGAVQKLQQSYLDGTQDKYLTGTGADRAFKTNNPFTKLFVDEGKVDDILMNRLNNQMFTAPTELGSQYRTALGLMETDPSAIAKGGLTPMEYLASNQKEINNRASARKVTDELAGMTTADGKSIIVPEAIKNNPTALKQLKSRVEEDISRGPYGVKGTTDYNRYRQSVQDENAQTLQKHNMNIQTDTANLARYVQEQAAFQASELNKYNNRVLDWKSGEAAADRNYQGQMLQMQLNSQREDRLARESAAERKERMQMMLALIARGTQGLQAVRF